MPKKKRTLKQKQQADLREQPSVAPQTTNQERQSYQYSLEHLSLPKTKTPVVKQSHVQAISTSDYAYIAPDLRKTFLITGAVVVVELFIRYFAIGNY